MILAGAVLLATCSSNKEDGKTDQAAKGPDFLASNIDSSANPAVDFFQFANGGWLKRNPIPASEASWGIGAMVYEDIYVKKLKINEDAAKANAAEGTETRKIGDFWLTAMDSAKADKEGVQPIAKHLAAIDAIKTPADVVAVAADLNRYGIGTYWTFYIDQDAKNSEKIALQFYQGGLSLPDRDSYLNNEDGVVKTRNAFPGHIGRMLVLGGMAEKEAMVAGEQVFKLETELAKASRALEDLRIPEKNYNKMTVADFTAKHTPNIDWKKIMTGYGISNPDTVIVGQPEFMAAVSKLLKTIPVADHKNYLRYHLLSAYSPFLGKSLDDENFGFYGRTLEGQSEQRPRWKRVLDAEENVMGMVLGKIFVKEFFPERTKKRYDDMVEAIRTVYSERIKNLDWMSPETKEKAQQKLSKMSKKVGYPDKWKDFSGLKIGRTSFAENMMNASLWGFNDMVSKFGKPVDRTLWTMTPQTYNAYYNPSNNEIVLPAGIFLIAGISDDDADDAMVYGYAAASTIGHEITHGFDDEGRQFDAAGNLASWWTKEDEAKFNTRAEVMVKQFDAFEPLPGLHINGKATLGENIADFGGVVLGLEAFKKTEQYKKGEKIGGYTPVQRYFLGYALGWLYQQKEDRLRQRLLSDVHSPAKWRVNGPFSNVPEFYEAFGVKEGDPMWRSETDRVKIW